MSHFTTIKTRIRDLDCLKSSLSSLGFQYEEGQCSVKDFTKKSVSVELAIRTGTGYDIGFQQSEGEYEIVADWWGVKRYAGLEEKQTVEKIRQRYAYEKVMKERQKLKEEGFVLFKEEVTEENVQVITLRKL